MGISATKIDKRLAKSWPKGWQIVGQKHLLNIAPTLTQHWTNVVGPMLPQPFSNGWPNVGLIYWCYLGGDHCQCWPNIALLSGTCLHDYVTSQVASISRANVGPTIWEWSSQHQPNVDLSIGPMFSWYWSNNEPTFSQCWANVFLPIFWSTFCQFFSDLLPTFGFPYIVPLITHRFDVIKMPRKYHISKHVLVYAMKLDIPMTYLRHFANSPPTILKKGQSMVPFPTLTQRWQ